MTRLTTTQLEDRLLDSLAPIADAAPMPPRVLEVPDGWVRGGRAAWASRHPVLTAVGVAAAAVLAVAVLVGLFGPFLQAPRVGDDGADASLPMERINLAPVLIGNPAVAGVPEAEAATGDVVQVARGRVANVAFRLVAYRSGGGNCLWFEHAGQASSGCAPVPDRDPMSDGVLGMGMFRLDPTVESHLVGLVAYDAARVQVRAMDDRRAEAQLIDLEPAGIAAQAYVVFLPIGFEADRIEVAARDGTRLTELRLDEQWRMGVPPDRARPLVPEPSVVVVLRNHTDARPILRMTTQHAGAAGEGWTPVDSCEVTSMEAPIRPGLDWSVDVDGQVVIDSTAPLPTAEPHTIVEVIIELRPGEAPTVSSTSVRSIEASTIGPDAGRPELPGRSERWWELGAGLDCEWEPGP